MLPLISAMTESSPLTKDPIKGGKNRPLSKGEQMMKTLGFMPQVYNPADLARILGAYSNTGDLTRATTETDAYYLRKNLSKPKGGSDQFTPGPLPNMPPISLGESNMDTGLSYGADNSMYGMLQPNSDPQAPVFQDNTDPSKYMMDPNNVPGLDRAKGPESVKENIATQVGKALLAMSAGGGNNSAANVLQALQNQTDSEQLNRLRQSQFEAEQNAAARIPAMDRLRVEQFNKGPMMENELRQGNAISAANREGKTREFEFQQRKQLMDKELAATQQQIQERVQAMSRGGKPSDLQEKVSLANQMVQDGRMSKHTYDYLMKTLVNPNYIPGIEGEAPLTLEEAFVQSMNKK